MPANILFLIPYPLQAAPSQRFRFEQYLDILRTQGFHVTIQSFLNTDNWKIFYTNGQFIRKNAALVSGFIRRLSILLDLRSYDFIFIHREVTPIGPPVFEWIIAKVYRKKIIYDFDDAIWMSDNRHESAVIAFLKCRRKVQMICRWSYKVSCGNKYLAAFASRFNDTVVINPTTVDTKIHAPRAESQPTNRHLVYVGWTGTHSTLKYLLTIEQVLRKLQDTFEHVWFIAIADRKPDLTLPRLLFLPWSKETEIEDLSKIDIGIMPLYNSEWEKGKCGFKALQYMAMEIPSVVSPVGANKDIIIHGENGFFASTDHEWCNALELLIKDKDLRRRIGIAGRKKVGSAFSVQANTSTFLALFE